MNSITTIASLALLCATTLPAQGEREKEAPPAVREKVGEPPGAVLRDAELQRVIEAARDAVEKAKDLTRAEDVAEAKGALRVQLLERAAVAEKALIVPVARKEAIRVWLARQTAPQPTPMMKGDYQKAVEKLEAAQRTMRTAADPEAAMRAIDEASKALMEARAAAWKQKEAAAEKKSEAKTKDG